MYNTCALDKFLIVTFVFLLSLAVGYYPVTAQIISEGEDNNPTRASIWLSIR